jgi:hypothetical protein
MAQTCLREKPNFSLGCNSSMKFSGIADEEMVMGFPGDGGCNKNHHPGSWFKKTVKR